MRIFYSLLFFIITYYFWPDKSYNSLPFSRWDIQILSDFLWKAAGALFFGYWGFWLLGKGLEEDRILKKWTLRYFGSLLIKLIEVFAFLAIYVYIFSLVLDKYNSLLNSDIFYYIEIGGGLLVLLSITGIMAQSEDETIANLFVSNKGSTSGNFKLTDKR